MKFLAFLALTASFTSAYASQKFGGVRFDATVEDAHVQSMKKDLSYLFTNPMVEEDKEFLDMTRLYKGDGPSLHNWVLNRVKHVTGEKYSLNDTTVTYSILRSLWFRFPNTPLPDVFASNLVGSTENPKAEVEEPAVKTVMSNIGTVVYLVGKKQNMLQGFKFEDGTVYAKSPRVGVLQVGEGLFFEKFLHNKNINAPANSVSRLSTLFHEARHSDGTGKNTGFLHQICPAGHPFAGYAACELVGNGPYTIGALAQRHLIKSCKACSTTELTSLTIKVADSFDRVITKNKNADQIAANEVTINSYLILIKTYLEMMEKTNDENYRKSYQLAIDNLRKEVNRLFLINKVLLAAPKEKPVMGNAAPEGEVKMISLKDSMKLMKSSLANEK